MDKLKEFFNQETLLYMAFGVLTTVVNYAVFHLIYAVIMGGQGSLVANAVAFAAAVIFSFVVNKLFVFKSKGWTPAVLAREIPPFAASRLASFGIEELGLLVGETVLHWNEITVLTLGDVSIDGITVTKLALSGIVVVLNYVFCKLVVFKK